MKVVGLTGGIAMGKSSLTRVIAGMGIPVFDADLEVHQLYDHEDAIFQFCRDNIPDSVGRSGNIDRSIVSVAVFKDDALLASLSNFVNYYLDIRLMTWLANMRYNKGAPIVVIDAPLLFQSHWAMMCHETITVECDPETQRRRALGRQGMTDDKFDAIIRNQTTSEERIAQADHVIDSNLPLSEVSDYVAALLTDIRNN